jgi:hypothetical protein
MIGDDGLLAACSPLHYFEEEEPSVNNNTKRHYKNNNFSNSQKIILSPSTTMNINSRRGTKQSQSAAAAHRHLKRLDRFIQWFIILTATIIVIGSYYFIFSSTVLQSNTSDGGDNLSSNNNNIRGGADTASSSVINNNKRAKATIGYAITVSGCPKNNGSRGDFGAGILDGAAVLKHSIHLNSIRNNNNHHLSSQYDYQMYALVHPSAQSCATSQLEPLGYQILIRDVPVPLHEIQGDYLRTKVPNNGCCGEKEFVKLHAYTLVEHPVVVHLDLDTLVLKPMDDLFDAMIDGVIDNNNNKSSSNTNNNNSGKRNNGGIDVAFNDPIDTAQPINAFFTRDYNMAHKGMKHAGVQGGFLVLRPSMEVYNEFQEIIRKGDFRQNGGWGGMGFGPFYGVSVATIICFYFYASLLFVSLSFFVTVCDL